MAEVGTVEIAMAGSSVTVGEVHTAMLQNSCAVSAASAQRLLDIVPGLRVARSERPIHYASSPSVLTGVHCPVSTLSGSKVNAIGTVVSHMSLTGGHIVQGCGYSTIMPSRADRRQPWSYYLARPGVIEAVSRVDTTNVAEGFLAGNSLAGNLDLNAIVGRALDSIQRHKDLDHHVAARVPRTRMRWVIARAVPADITFAINSRNVRTIRLPWTESAGLAAHLELIEDIARHDWLLTAVTSLLDLLRVGGPDRSDAIDRLQPIMDHLVHLWMPAARGDPALAPLWRALEARPGFSRQWQVSVDRVRDQLTLAAVSLLRARLEEVVGGP